MKKIGMILDGGIVDSWTEGYYFLIDCGELRESEYLLTKCKKLDRK